MTQWDTRHKNFLVVNTFGKHIIQQKRDFASSANISFIQNDARESGVVDYIDTTTNGLLLESESIKPILNASLDKINISVDGMSDEQFLEFTGVKVNFKKYVQNIRSRSIIDPFISRRC